MSSTRCIPNLVRSADANAVRYSDNDIVSEDDRIRIIGVRG